MAHTALTDGILGWNLESDLRSRRSDALEASRVRVYKSRVWGVGFRL